jgi:prevent-host-death family protein
MKHLKKTWQLQEAKAHFSEVVREAINHGPQNITLHGKPSVVVISKVDFDNLVSKPKLSFVQFMQSSPLKGANVDFTRNTTLTRNVDL